MSDHSHYRTFRESRAALPGLLVAFILEAPALIFGHQLAITAHIFDIFSDMAAFGVVIFGALVSGLIDDRGRNHSADQIHTEQVAIACISLSVLWLGGALVLITAINNFGGETEAVGWRDWWLLPGPVVSLFVYAWLREKVLQIKATDITTEGLAQHVRGDVLIAALVVFLTVLNMASKTNWINPAGGVIMAVILFSLGMGYFVQIKKTVEKNF